MEFKKELLLILLTCLLVTNVKAQDSDSTNNSDTITWSYADQDPQYFQGCGVGRNDPGTVYKTFIRVNPKAQGISYYQLDGISIGLSPKSNMDKVWIWISTSFPSRLQEPDICYQEVTLPDNEISDKYSLQTFEFDTKPLLTNKDVYIGYSYVLSENNNKFPIYASTNGTPSEGDTFFIDVDGDLYDMSSTDIPFAMIYLNLTKPIIIVQTGDVNNDEHINVLDVTLTVGYILNNLTEKIYVDAADVNGDGICNITDVEAIIDLALEKEITETDIVENDDILTMHYSDGQTGMYLSSASGYKALQMDVVLKEGSEISEISLNDKLRTSHNISYNRIGDGKYRVLVYSNDGGCFYSGNILNIGTTYSNINIENILFVTPEGNEKHFENIRESDITGIETIETDANTDAVYNLYGERVKNTNAHGVYIVRGKKVIK